MGPFSRDGYKSKKRKKKATKSATNSPMPPEESRKFKILVEKLIMNRSAMNQDFSPVKDEILKEENHRGEGGKSFERQHGCEMVKSFEREEVKKNDTFIQDEFI